MSGPLSFIHSGGVSWFSVVRLAEHSAPTQAALQVLSKYMNKSLTTNLSTEPTTESQPSLTNQPLLAEELITGDRERRYQLSCDSQDVTSSLKAY